MINSPVRRAGVIYGVWATLSLLVIAGNLHYLRGVWLYERNSSFERAEAATDVMEQALLRSADGVSSVLNFAQTRVELAREGASRASAALDRRLMDIIDEGHLGIRGVASVRLDGIIDWSPSGELIGITASNREQFAALAQATTTTLAVSAPFISRLTGQWIITAARSMHDADGQNTGIIVVGLDPMQLSRLLTTVAGKPERALEIIQLADGQVRAAAFDTHERMRAGPAPDDPVVRAARQAGSGRLEYVSPWNGRPVLTAFRVIPARDLVVYAAFDEAAEMAAYERLARPVMVAAGLYVLASLLMAAAWDRNARLRRSLHQLARLDPLTGLQNRRALEEQMRHHGAQGFACLLFDIDHFKSINDRFGHARGDEVLQDVARLLRSEVRGGDIVCRWGGEEMLVVLRQCDRDKALIRAEALRGAIESMYDDAHRVTASVGVACFPGDGDTLAAITGLADEALYRAKRGGRNRVAMVDPALA